MNCYRVKQNLIQRVGPVIGLFKRSRAFKAARCEKVTLKSVDWYLLPLIRDMEA